MPAQIINTGHRRISQPPKPDPAGARKMASPTATSRRPSNSVPLRFLRGVATGYLPPVTGAVHRANVARNLLGVRIRDERVRRPLRVLGRIAGLIRTLEIARQQVTAEQDQSGGQQAGG